jgi:TolB-like protein
MSFFGELQRRNVLRVAVGYAVLSWVLLQIMDVLAPALRLPEWTISLVAVLLVLGAVPTLIFSWIYEMTPEGLKKESDISREDSVTAHTAKKLDVAVIVLLVSAIAIALLRPDAVPAPATTDSVAPSGSEVTTNISEVTDSAIAVLPFADLSPDGDQGYFADGISEEILNLLAQNSDLKVIARTSAFQFREAVDLREVGRQLNANRILEGSVRTAGMRVRITAQLIDADTGLHIWSDTYDRQLNDIFAVQDEIAAAITEALGVHLGVAPSSAAAASASDETIDAYNLYLQGRQSLAERALVGRMGDAIALLERAVAADPELVVARGTLALAHSLSSNWVPGITAPQAAQRALAIANETLALDPDSVEALVAKGYALSLAFRIAESESMLTRALELRPNDLMAVNLTGDLYRATGDTERSLVFERRATELDPLDSVMHLDLAWTYIFAGRFEEAIPHARRAAALSAGNTSARFALAYALTLTGQLDEAERVADALAAVESTAPLLVDINRINQATIRQDDALTESLIAAAEPRWRAMGLPDSQFAFFAAVRGDYAEVARIYQRALGVGDFGFLRGPTGLSVPRELEARGLALDFPDALDELMARRRVHAASIPSYTEQIEAARAAYEARRR